ncbi:MAG: hypothetical protein ACF8R7_12470 [Phycisphaerales bacterium JB039]
MTHSGPIRLADLRRLAAIVGQASGEGESGAFDCLGLCLADDDYRNASTPLNSRTFAYTGVDGVHFGLVALPDRPESEWPVVETCPMDFSAQHIIAGKNLRDFLELGVSARSFHLTIAGPADDEPDMAPGVEELRKLAILREHFGLKDRTDHEEWGRELQVRYRGLLELGPGAIFE